MTNPIKVVDACMGAGKTTGIFKKIELGEISLPVLYISPFLDEVGDGDTDGRIQRSLPDFDFIAPKELPNKSAHIEQLAKEGSNIACTHSLMQKLSDEALRYLVDNGYTIIIDEAINAFESIDISTSDLDNLREVGLITIDDNRQLSWEDIKDYDGKFNDLRIACKRGAVFLAGNSQLLMWEFPVALFDSSLDVWVMTYPFEGTMMKSYFDIYNFDYEIVADEELDLRPEHELIAEAAQLLEIYEGRSNDVGRGIKALSSTNLNSKAIRKVLSKSMRTVAVSTWKAKSDDLVWTTFKKAVPEASPVGFKTRHIACNLRATNDYADCSHVMYGVNIFVNPEIRNHINSRGARFDQDAYALGEMLQLLWRGCIRKGKPMKVFIPSRRMRDLLYSWLSKYEEMAIAA